MNKKLFQELLDVLGREGDDLAKFDVVTGKQILGDELDNVMLSAAENEAIKKKVAEMPEEELSQGIPKEAWMVPLLAGGAVAADGMMNESEAITPKMVRNFMIDQARTRGPVTGSLVDQVARGSWYNGGSWYPEIGRTFKDFQTGQNIIPKLGEPWGISLSARPEVSKAFAKPRLGPNPNAVEFGAQIIASDKYAIDYYLSHLMELGVMDDKTAANVKELVNSPVKDWKTLPEFPSDLYEAEKAIEQAINKLTPEQQLDYFLQNDIELNSSGDTHSLFERDKYLARVNPEFRSSPDSSVLPTWVPQKRGMDYLGNRTEATPDYDRIKAANDLLNEAYVDASYRLAKDNGTFGTVSNFGGLPNYDPEYAEKLLARHGNDLAKEAILRREFGNPKQVDGVPLTPTIYKHGSRTVNTFNQYLSDSLQDRGIDALLYSPHRWGEYEMRMLNPDRVRMIEEIPVSNNTSGLVLNHMSDGRTYPEFVNPNKYTLAAAGEHIFPKVSRWSKEAPETGKNLGDVYARNDFWINPMKYGGKYLLGVPAAAAVYGMMNPDEADAMYIGKKGLTNMFGDAVANDKVWELAKMTEEGFSPEAIKRATNMHIGMEGAPRFEISDADMYRKPLTMDDYVALAQGEIKLGDLYEHPELFRAYPDLGKVRVGEIEGNGVKGEYDRLGKKISLDRGLDPWERDNTAIHEVQHAVQDLEGHGYGANVPALQRYVDDGRLPDASGEDAYNRVAGEMEAEDAVHRRDLDMKYRLKLPAARTSRPIIVAGDDTPKSAMDYLMDDIGDVASRVGDNISRGAKTTGRFLDNASKYIGGELMNNPLGLMNEAAYMLAPLYGTSQDYASVFQDPNSTWLDKLTASEWLALDAATAGIAGKGATALRHLF